MLMHMVFISLQKGLAAIFLYVYANKKSTVQFILFVVFNVKLGEIISVCVLVLSEHFQHNSTVPR